MFGKKKKEPKVEKVFESDKPNDENAPESENNPEVDEARENSDKDLKEMFGEDSLDTQDIEQDDGLTDEQKEKYEKLGSLRDKISRILKSSNVEIVDENIGDEYIVDTKADSKKQQQEDYDSLKALFGSEKSHKQELTLTIDDYDYTYVGQYVDEYDIMHLKTIKKIRLQRKKPKHLKAMIISACAVLVVGIGVLVGFLLTRETPTYLVSISLNQSSNYYYVGETFDYTGLTLTLSYSDGTTEEVPLSRDYLSDTTGYYNDNGTTTTFTDGPSSISDLESVLKFSYGGYTVEYTVNIKRKSATGISAIYSAGLFSLSSDEYISNKNLIILCEYSTTDSDGETISYGQEFLDLSNVTISLDGNALTYENGNGFKVEDKTTSSTITISYSGYSIELTYDENLPIVSSN